MGLFISHAEVDKPLVDPLVDLLQTGVSVPQKDIFCTSLEGMGIPRGNNLVGFIHDKLTSADFVIMVVTPRYYESAFCLCELGATWALCQNIFPLIVPPLDYDSLQAVLVGIQSGYVNDKRALNDLRDQLLEENLGSGATGRWEQKRDTFISSFPRIQQQLEGPSVVSYSEHQKTVRAYQAAQEQIAEDAERIRHLESIIEELKACKDRFAVNKVLRGHSTKQARFDDLVAAASAELAGIPCAAVESLYYHFKGVEWAGPPVFNNEHIWEAIQEAEERGFLSNSGGTIHVTEDNPRMRRAIAALEELAAFIREASGDFHEAFEQDHDFQLRLDVRDFWEDLLGLN